MVKTSKISDERIAAICTVVEQGLPFEEAALVAGISRATFYDWRGRGKKDIDAGNTETLFARLVDEMDKAQSKFIQNNVNNVQQIALTGEWTASAWLLERRAPHHFAKQNNINVEGSVHVKEYEGVDPEDV